MIHNPRWLTLFNKILQGTKRPHRETMEKSHTASIRRVINTIYSKFMVQWNWQNRILLSVTYRWLGCVNEKHDCHSAEQKRLTMKLEGYGVCLQVRVKTAALLRQPRQ